MISKRSCNNLDGQGYTFLSTEKKNVLNIALRVTPLVCVVLVIAGLYYQSIVIFLTLSTFALLGVITTKRQPIDALYNFFAGMTGRQKLPPSPTQKRVACAVGLFFLGGATVSIYLGSSLWVYIFAISYVAAAGTMALTHFCFASWIYNYIRSK